jgi:hypothetical protein
MIVGERKPRQWQGYLFLLIFFLTGGCATCRNPTDRPFVVGRDSFAYANELVWEYAMDKDNPPPSSDSRYVHHCFPMARAAREFFNHAQFAPDLPETNATTYAALIRGVTRRDSRCVSPSQEKIIIPGFSSLQEFSRVHPDLLKNNGGGAWLSYVQRGNWRMIFPLTRRQQERTSARLLDKIMQGQLPIVHLYQFPKISINHAVLLHAAEEKDGSIHFLGYDPNIPTRPVELRFDKRTRTFLFERNHYFAGGAVKLYEVYRDAFH